MIPRRLTKTSIVSTLAVLGLTVAACASTATPTASPTADRRPPSSAATITTPPPFTLQPSTPPGAMTEQARLDLAQRLSIPSAAVDVVSITREPVPIDALRCTPRDAQQPQVTLPGLVNATEIVLRVGSQEYTYYVRGRQLIRCDRPAP